MDNEVFDKQAEEAVAELVMASEGKTSITCPDTMRELLLATYKAGGYQYAKMLSIERLEVADYLTGKYGVNVGQRIAKLREEVEELSEAYASVIEPDDIGEFIDELADVTIVAFHIASIFDYSQEELLKIASHKIKVREKNPNYQRNKVS